MQRAPFYGAGRIVEEGFGHESGSGDLLVKIRASRVCGSDVGHLGVGQLARAGPRDNGGVAGWDRAPLPCRSSRLRVPRWSSGAWVMPFGQQGSVPRHGDARRRLRRRRGRYRPGRALPFRGRRVRAGPSVSMCPQSRRWSWEERWDSAAYRRGGRSGSASRPVDSELERRDVADPARRASPGRRGRGHEWVPALPRRTAAGDPGVGQPSRPATGDQPACPSG